MRVSMSAIGSVIVIGSPPSPRRLRHAGDLPGVGQVPEADPTEPELPVHRARATALPASGVRTHGELGLPLLLLDQCLLGQRVLPTGLSLGGTGSRAPAAARARRRRWWRSSRG